MRTLDNEEIKTFLETAGMYRDSVYQLPSINRSDIRVDQVDGYCEICCQVRPFKDVYKPDSFRAAMISRAQAQALSSGHTEFKFRCFTCDNGELIFSVHHLVKDRSITLQKIGEYPRKKLVRDPQLEKFFTNDSECYEKAVVCLAQGYGIGAFCYFRRIVEVNINSLLEMLREELVSTNANNELLENLTILSNRAPMCDKIDVANKALPEYMITSGLNPLGRLYAVLSEGVHNDSDEVCLQRSVAIEECLKYMISELTTRKKNRDSFASMVGRI